ncbi:MAG: LapA family protein [Pseudomonadota bacterium]
MRRFLTTSVLFVFGIVLVAFLVANRQTVTISFDPFNTTDPAFSFSAPLWAAPAGSLLIGYVLGALGMWLSNSGLRQRAAERQKKVRELEREVDLANDASVKTASAATRLPALRS